MSPWKGCGLGMDFGWGKGGLVEKMVPRGEDVA